MRAMVAACLLTASLTRPPAPAQAATHGIVETGDSRATQAAIAVLRDGGTAIDAAIAAQMVLGVVLPQRSGLGGGGFMIAYDAATRHVSTWDGSDTAPAVVRTEPSAANGRKPSDPQAARRGGQSVAVPGLALLLRSAYRAGGHLAWSRLLAPAIALAEGGFVVSPPLADDVADHRAALEAAGDRDFLPGGQAVQAGATLRLPALARTLRAVARDGAAALYRGDIATAIALAVRGDAAPGLLTVDDLAAHRTRARPAICDLARGLTLCGMGPPSDGGIGVVQILGLLAKFDLDRMATPASASLIDQAERLAAGDGERYVTDPDLAEVPTERLIAPTYLNIRAQQLDPRLPAVPVVPPRRAVSTICVVDTAGDVVALTSSLGDVFGSMLMVRGMLLNDGLAQFAHGREADPHVNQLMPGARAASMLSPTLVFGSGDSVRAVLAAGSPGQVARSILGRAVSGVARIDVGANRSPDPAAAGALAGTPRPVP